MLRTKSQLLTEKSIAKDEVEKLKSKMIWDLSILTEVIGRKLDFSDPNCYDMIAMAAHHYQESYNKYAVAQCDYIAKYDNPCIMVFDDTKLKGGN